MRDVTCALSVSRSLARVFLQQQTEKRGVDRLYRLEQSEALLLHFCYTLISLVSEGETIAVL
jgi:hypothetical protein